MSSKIFVPSILAMFCFVQVFAQSGSYTHAENYGGKQALKDLLKNELVYPQSARDNKQEGVVVISSVITKDGHVENVYVQESLGDDLDAEALRLFNFLLWVPAKNKGVNIAEETTLEVEFKLKRYNKYVKGRGYDQIDYPHPARDESFAIYNIKTVDQMPTPVYPKGDMKFGEFMVQNLKYPETAKKQGISGTVEMFFIVETSGNVSNIQVLQQVGAGCNEEAKRLLKLLKWYPGLLNELAVRTEMKFSVTFNMDDSENMRYVPANNSSQM